MDSATANSLLSGAWSQLKKKGNLPAWPETRRGPWQGRPIGHLKLVDGLQRCLLGRFSFCTPESWR